MLQYSELENWSKCNHERVAYRKGLLHLCLFQLIFLTYVYVDLTRTSAEENPFWLTNVKNYPISDHLNSLRYIKFPLVLPIKLKRYSKIGLLLQTRSMD